MRRTARSLLSDSLRIPDLCCYCDGAGGIHVGLTLSLMSSSMGLLPHSISTISLACPGTAYENGVPMPGEALDRSHRQMVKAYSSGSVFLILPYR